MQRYTFFAKQPNVWKEYIELVKNFDQFFLLVFIHLKEIAIRKLLRVVLHSLIHSFRFNTIKCRHITIKQHILSSQLDDKILHIICLYDFIYNISLFFVCENYRTFQTTQKNQKEDYLVIMANSPYYLDIQFSIIIFSIFLKSFMFSVTITISFTTAVQPINKSKLLAIGVPANCNLHFSLTK